MTKKKTSNLPSLLSKDLTEIKNKDKIQEMFTTEGGIEPLIEQAQEIFLEFKSKEDLTTPEGRDAVRSRAHKFSKLKKPLDNLAVEAIKEPKLIVTNAGVNRKKLEKQLDVFRDKTKESLIEWENAKAVFDEACAKKIQLMISFGLSHNNGKLYTLEQLEANKAELDKITIDPDKFREHTDEANAALFTSLESIEEHINVEKKKISDAEEAKRLEEANKAKDDEIEALKKKLAESEKKAEDEKQARIESEKSDLAENTSVDTDESEKDESPEETKTSTNFEKLEDFASGGAVSADIEPVGDSGSEVSLESHKSSITNPFEPKVKKLDAESGDVEDATDKDIRNNVLKSLESYMSDRQAKTLLTAIVTKKISFLYIAKAENI